MSKLDICFGEAGMCVIADCKGKAVNPPRYFKSIYFYHCDRHQHVAADYPLYTGSTEGDWKPEGMSEPEVMTEWW